MTSLAPANTLPLECIQHIINSIQTTDLFTLYNCLLINRSWNFPATQTLWQNPFNLLLEKRTDTTESVQVWRQKAPILIETYLSILDKDSRKSLKEGGIILSKIRRTINIDYASFSQTIDIEQLVDGVNCWFALSRVKAIRKRKSIFYSLRCSSKINQLTTSIFTPKNGAKYVTDSQKYRENCENLITQILFKMLLNRATSIKILTITKFRNPNFFLLRLASATCNLKKIKIWQPLDRNLVHNFSTNHQKIQLPILIKLIESQKGLQELDLGNWKDDSTIMNSICQALKTQSKTFCRLSITRISTLGWSCLTSLSECKKLKEFHIFDCDGEPYPQWGHSFISMKIIKLKKLNISTVISEDIVIDMIRHSNTELKTIIIGGTVTKSLNNSNQILWIIAENCPNLEKLYCHISRETIASIHNLLISCPNLKELILYDSSASLPYMLHLNQLIDLCKIHQKLLKNLDFLHLEISINFDYETLKYFLNIMNDFIRPEISYCECDGEEHLDLIIDYNLIKKIKVKVYGESPRN